jgi:hypothetical protein
MSLIRTPFIAAVALAGAMCAGAARAGDVHWTIGISAPLGYGGSVGTVFSNGHMAPIHSAPVYLAPAPVFYAPPPVVYEPAPMYYPAQPGYLPRRVMIPLPVVAPVWGRGHHAHRHPYGERSHREAHGAPVYAPQGGHAHHFPS